MNKPDAALLDLLPRTSRGGTRVQLAHALPPRRDEVITYQWNLDFNNLSTDDDHWLSL